MKTVIKMLLLALVYACAGKLGLKLAYVNVSATAVWPPAGIALAALLLLGYRVWPGILLGAFIVNLSTAGTVATSLAIGAGNTLEAVAACYLVNRFANGRRVFEHPYTIFKYTVLAAMVSTMVAATVGVTTLATAGFAEWANYGPIWLTWWLGDAAGVLLVAPLAILWSAPLHARWESEKAVETGLVALTLILLGLMVFRGFFLTGLAPYPLEFLCTPVILWAAFRLGKRLTATATFLLSVLAIWGTLEGFGPFSRASHNASLLLLQAYMSVVAVMSLAVAAVVSERRRSHEELEAKVLERTASLMSTIQVLEEEMADRERAEKALHVSETRFCRLMESNVIGLMTVDREGMILEANEAFLKIVGCRKEQLHQRRLSARALIPPEFHTQEEWASQQMRARGVSPTLETEFIHNDGTRVPVVIGGVQVEESPARSVYFVIDVSHRRQAMDALRKAYDEIEVRVEERTKELCQLNEELSKEIARRQQAEAELRSLSISDPLTGLYNRRGFLALAEQQWLQAARDKRSFLLFFADVDGLKAINDTLGHPRGDQALIEAAEALKRTFRKSDVLARIGGDEFAIVAAQVPLDYAQTYRTRLETQLNEVNAAARFPFKLSLSLGAATFDPQKASSIQDLMHQADEDLYARRHTVRGV